MASATTEAKLLDDIAWAVEHDIHGTPLVLVNGRKAPAFEQRRRVSPILTALTPAPPSVR